MNRFDGATYDAKYDETRLSKQLSIVTGYMLSVVDWQTLPEISQATGISPTSASARLRDLRKEKNGGWTVDLRLRGDRKNGLYEYKVQIPANLTDLQKKELVDKYKQSMLTPVITISSAQQPTEDQIKNFVEWLRPIYASLAKQGNIHQDILPVCQWLSKGAPR